MSESTGSDHRRSAQFKCAQTVIGQRSAGNGPNGLSYDDYYYYYYYYYLHRTYHHYSFPQASIAPCTRRPQATRHRKSKHSTHVPVMTSYTIPQATRLYTKQHILFNIYNEFNNNKVSIIEVLLISKITTSISRGIMAPASTEPSNFLHKLCFCLSPLIMTPTVPIKILDRFISVSQLFFHGLSLYLCLALIKIVIQLYQLNTGPLTMVTNPPYCLSFIYLLTSIEITTLYFS